MTPFATVMYKPERTLTVALGALALLGASPSLARDQDEPMAGRTPDARDVAMTPLTDLNLSKDPIPAVLLSAVAAPYDSTGTRNCSELGASIAALDSALGPDMDVAESDPDRLSVGSVAKSVVASFIPFRGIVREVTGAADHKRQFEAAIYAGAVRRGYLKGLGQQRKCPYPARPAVMRVAVPAVAQKPEKSAPVDDPPGFVSRPVVQGEAQPAETTGKPRG